MAYKTKAEAAAAQKRWRQQNPAKSKAIYRRFALNNPNNVLNAHLKHRYGITLEDARRMLLEQGGGCAICARQIVIETKEHRAKAVVDHDHDTHRVRGLLCHDCNKGLGSLKDDPAIVRAAADYLRFHKRAVA